jgi:membrane associated rhomboid family serine protease
MRCPECAGERTRVRRGVAAIASTATPYATYALLTLNVIAFLGELFAGGGAGSPGGGGNDLIADGGLCGNAIADGGICGIDGSAVLSDGGEVFRLVSGGFLHAGPLHLLLNMFALYILGTLLEPAIGTVRFVAIYFAALFAGAFGALLLTDPNEVTVGASGAIFGLMGAAFVVARRRGIDEVASQVGLFVVLNLVFTFSIPGISIGGHVGGLVGGALAALIVTALERRGRGGTSIAIESVGIALIALASVAGALAAAGGSI